MAGEHHRNRGARLQLVEPLQPRTAVRVPAAVAERPDDSGAFWWIVVDVTLAPLAIGDYLVEVRQGEATEITACRVVP